MPHSGRLNPSMIVVVRHAEKPEKGSAPHLAVRGKMRAIGLSKLLPKMFHNVRFIFASTSTKNSERPYETIRSTAKKLGLKIRTKFADKQVKKIAKELDRKRYAGKTVVICWHHGQIPQLIEELGFPSPYKKWPPEVFDRLIVMDDDGLLNLPQRLLFGDSGE